MVAVERRNSAGKRRNSKIGVAPQSSEAETNTPLRSQSCSICKTLPKSPIAFSTTFSLHFHPSSRWSFRRPSPPELRPPRRAPQLSVRHQPSHACLRQRTRSLARANAWRRLARNDASSLDSISCTQPETCLASRCSSGAHSTNHQLQCRRRIYRRDLHLLHRVYYQVFTHNRRHRGCQGLSSAPPRHLL